MSRKIIGVTVGTQLPKPNFKQNDPTKGDYIKNKPDFDGLKAQVDDISDLADQIAVSLPNKADLVNGKIPLAQLPDGLGSGEGDTLIQKQADYNQNDPTQVDYILNRPFYDTRKQSLYSYAENPNPVSFDCAPMGYSFYKVSDLVLTKDDIFNATIIINGAEQDKIVQADVLIETEKIIIAQYSNVANGYAFCFCGVTGTCPFTFMGHSLSVNVPETGVYRISGLGLGMAGVSTLEISLGGELKQIDPKFIPANLDFDLSDYYTKEEIVNDYYTKEEMNGILGDCRAILDEISELIGE